MTNNLIRKEIKKDNSFGGNYPYSVNYQDIPEHFIDITPEQRDIIDTDITRYIYDVTQDGIFVTPKGVVDIVNTPPYQQKLLTAVKKQKFLENKQALENKESFNTSFGVVKINTPIGRVDVMATGFLNLVSLTKTNLPAGTFRTYTDGHEVSSPELTPEQVGAFYLEIFNKLNTLDKTYKNYETQINEAETMEELDTIKIDYSTI